VAGSHSYLKQLILIMKLTVFILFIALAQIHAEGYSQTVTISQKNVSLGTVFRDIQKQTGYNFLCTKEQLSLTRPVDIDVRNLQLDKVLELCFRDQPLTYSLLNKTIIVRQKTGTADAGPQLLHISGSIRDSATGAPLPGVTIQVKGNTLGTITDASGNFSMDVPAQATLVISFLGYERKEIPVTGAATINVSLAAATTGLNQLVVVGYGTIRKSNLSSAVATISSKEIERTNNTTLEQAIQGRAPNVYVTSTSGQPGAGSSIIIRGVSTITGNYQPLYVIDGVQIRPDPPAGGAYNQPSGYANALAGINPDDIKSNNILEGPSATSIYGAAGANGVIVITTKSGEPGRTRLTLSSTLTRQEPPSFLPVMDLKQYAAYILKLQSLGAVGSEPAELQDPSLLGKGTNWQAALFRPTLMQKHSLTVSGGSGKSTYYFSGDYLNQQGVALGSGFERGSVRLNIDDKPSKWVSFGANLSAFTTKENVNTTNGNLIITAITQNPTIPVKNPDGTWGGPEAPEAKYSQTNPIALASLNNNYNTSLGVIGGVHIDITPIRGLDIHSEANGTYNFINNYTFNPSYVVGSFSNPNTKGSRAANNNHWASINTRIQYSFNFGRNNFSVMAGHEAQMFGYQGLQGAGQNFSTNSVQELSVADPLTQTTTSNRGDGASESFFSRLDYNYGGKYIAQIVVRRDGSSNFGAANRFGTFPAASAAWVVSKEKFMQSVGFIDNLKVRAEYGVSGNTGNNGGAIYSNLYASATVWGGGFLPSNFPNPNLKWEQDKSADLGLDVDLLDSRVQITADAYVKHISNLILVAQGPEYMGGTLSGGYGGYISWPTENYGGMENRGFGVTVKTVDINTGAFQWTTSFNFAVDKNKVTKLVAPILTQYTSTTNNNQAEFQTTVGQPLSMITGYIAEGLFQNYKDIAGHAIQTSSSSGTPQLTIDPRQGSWVGDIKFKDISGPDGKPDGVIDQFDRTIIGNPWPKFTYNFNTEFSYKGFDLNVFFVGVYGNQILNLLRYENELPLGTGEYNNHPVSAINFAVPSSSAAADALSVTLTNPGHRIPRIVVSGDPNGNVRLTQWDVESGSYLKLKNVRLSYTVPDKYLGFLKVFTGITASIQAQNLFTITKYTGLDPEVGMYNYKGVTNIVGMDEGRYPTTRSYALSLSLNF
jgi:TonB-linked SusC/RagA family outer membrane protein